MLLVACTQAVTAADVEQHGCPCTLDGLDTDVNDLIDSVSDLLCELSGGLMCGRCESDRRPCSEGACVCGFGCLWGCCRPAGIPLYGFGVNPVILEVRIDGDTFTDWAVVESSYDGAKLVRTDGRTWPTNQYPLRPPSEVGTFQITVESGAEWSFIAQMAAYEVICEMAAVLTNQPNKLPPGTMAATMDGVSVVIGRLPGQAELEAVGLTWLARFVGLWGPAATAEVKSPELTEGWVLPVITFAE